MKNTKTIIIVFGIVVLGAIGYYFHSSIQAIDQNNIDYNFEPAPLVQTEFDELDELEQSEIELEETTNELEDLDFETPSVITIEADAIIEDAEADLIIDQAELELENLNTEDDLLELQIQDLESLDF